MNSHPYLRAYMAGIPVPTVLLLGAFVTYCVARFGIDVNVPVERALVFPLALVPNLWGLWNILYVALRERRHPPLGIHGALLPLILMPSGLAVLGLVGIHVPGAVITAEVFIPRMIAARSGHLIGISSLADRLIDSHAPSYSASKAGLSQYLEGLALACHPYGVSITNVRFGFVDTAMAKSPTKPFMVTADRAARVIEDCIATRPIRRSFPLRMAAVTWLLGWVNRLRIRVSRARTR